MLVMSVLLSLLPNRNSSSVYLFLYKNSTDIYYTCTYLHCLDCLICLLEEYWVVGVVLQLWVWPSLNVVVSYCKSVSIPLYPVGVCICMYLWVFMGLSLSLCGCGCGCVGVCMCVHTFLHFVH